MRMLVIVQTEQPDIYKPDGKPEVHKIKLTVFDQSQPQQDRIKGGFDIVLSEGDVSKFSGKVADRCLRVALTGLGQDFPYVNKATIYGLASGDAEDEKFLRGEVHTGIIPGAHSKGGAPK